MALRATNMTKDSVCPLRLSCLYLLTNSCCRRSSLSPSLSSTASAPRFEAIDLGTSSRSSLLPPCLNYRAHRMQPPQSRPGDDANSSVPPRALYPPAFLSSISCLVPIPLVPLHYCQSIAACHPQLAVLLPLFDVSQLCLSIGSALSGIRIVPVSCWA